MHGKTAIMLIALRVTLFTLAASALVSGGAAAQPAQTQFQRPATVPASPPVGRYACVHLGANGPMMENTDLIVMRHLHYRFGESQPGTFKYSTATRTLTPQSGGMPRNLVGTFAAAGVKQKYHMITLREAGGHAIEECTFAEK